MKFLLLDSLADRGGASLHARGRMATRALLNHLPRDLPGPVLEVGCGSGETAVQLCQYTGSVIAVDISARMLKSTFGRSEWCGVGSRLRIAQVSSDGKLPFATGSFSSVVVESVLAIQRPEILHRLINECKRVLRQRGRILVNETVWTAGTPKELAEKINHNAAESVGIIQATVDPFDANAWVEMFEAHGLSLIWKQRLDALLTDDSALPKNRGLLLRSRAFTAWKRFGALIAPGGIAERRRMARALTGLAPPQRCLEGVLFVLESSTTL